jgi:tRNA (mo5U34)-methyltransferase
MSNAILARVAALQWFHSIDLGGGIVTHGLASIGQLTAQANVYFQGDTAKGASVLDIGCWDGFNALEAVRRGASRVVALDHSVWHHHPWASRQTVELVREVAAPALEIVDLDLHAITPATMGRFDVVLFCGVLYHLRDMLAGLTAAASVADRMLIVETHMDAADLARPAAVFYPGAELNGDASNWWGPNQLCVEAMLSVLGFPKVEYTPHPTVPSRGIFRALRE